MKPENLLPKIAIAVIGAAVMIGFFTDGFGRNVSSTRQNAAGGQALMGAPLSPDLLNQSAGASLVGIAGFTPPMSVPGGSSAPGAMAGPMGGAAPMAPMIQAVQPAVAAPRPDMATQQTGPNVISTPTNFINDKIKLAEAHWQGMEAVSLTSELRRKLRYPQGLEGLLIDEVTLNAARSGFLAGDIIVSVGNERVVTLEDILRSSMKVRDLNQVPVTVLRKADKAPDGRFAMTSVTLVLRADPYLGFAQVETAPMIPAGATRPHPERGPCTDCHAIGKGLDLTPDPGLINLPPPTITQATAVKGVSPHRDRGPCVACHVITF